VTSPGDRISEDLRAAMKAGEKARLAALRMLATSIRNREVEVGHELSEEEFLEVVAREVKRRKEAAEAYDGAGRTELADREREEEEALEGYLPEALSQEEVDALVEEAVVATGASGPGDMGKVMGHVMGKARGRVDGAVVSARARERLGSG
jgi:uncharacterized protein YqeY